MTACVNRVTLLGRLNKRGVEVRYANGGTPCASFTIDLVEQTSTGQWFTTYINCEAWGKKAEAAGEIDPGALVLFEGKLKRQKRDEKLWETVVSGFELVAVAPGTAAER
jgi:single-stranded DNA-binding protein